MRSTNQTVALSKSLSLEVISLNSNKSVEVPQGKNVIFVCDVSGSMYGSLERMRVQLKNKVSALLGPEDTMTIIWFSGKGQAGIIQEMAKVSDVKQLKSMHDQIDKYLKTVGLTAFAEPLKLTNEVVSRIVKDNKNPIQFNFLSDGYNNDVPWSEVEKQIRALEGRVQSATIIEYGYYADSARLSQMAEDLGGTKIFAQDFDSYEVAFENIVKGTTSKLVPVDISSVKSDLKYQFLYSINANGVISVYSCEGKNEIQVPEHIKELYAITKVKSNTAISAELDNAALAGIFILADKQKVDVVDELLAFRGDVELINSYSKAYGKQKLNEFKDIISLQMLGDRQKFAEGQKTGHKAKKNQFCVLDLLDVLLGDEDNKILPYHPEFKYSPIGAKTVTSKVLTDSQKAELATAKTAKKAEKMLDSIEVASFDPLDKNEGYSVNNLVWNEERANVSIQFRIDGVVTLPKNNVGLTKVPSFIFRNYAIVKDGILNMTAFPCKLIPDTLAALVKADGVTLTNYPDGVTLVDFSALPVINKARMEKIKAKYLAGVEVELLKNQAVKKYIGYLKKQLPKSDVKAEETYTKEQVAYLLTQGVTSYSGFSPKVERVESEDFYVATALVTKIEKFSSLPTIEAVHKKAASGKAYTASEELIAEAIKTVDSKLGKFTPEQLYDLEKEYSNKIKPALKEIAQSKFSLIMSRTWFSDMKDDSAVIPVSIAGNDVNLEFTWKDENVKI